MRSRFFIHPALAGLLILPVVFLLWLLEWAREPAVEAAPHTIRKVRHPFDADWPDVYLILSAKCGGCHRPGCERVDLSSYQAIVDGRTPCGERLVVPGRPEASPLFQYVVWNHAFHDETELPATPMMPPEESEWLTGGQLGTLRQWIARGALQYRLPRHCSTRPLLEIDYPSAKECRACHPRQYEQWSRSMHAYAQHSPVLEAFTLTLVERTSGTIGTFCTRCHTPLGVALGENASRRNVHRSRLSMEGVTCVVCHRPTAPNYKSNGRLVIGEGKVLEACVYGPFEHAVSEQHGGHPAAASNYLKSSAFCGTCHDVTNPQGVRLEEAFSEWQNSPAAKDGITCQQCHMGPIQGVPIADKHRPVGPAAVVPGVPAEKLPLRHLTDHTFAGPDYSLLPDTEFPHKLDWMYEVDYRQTDELTPHQRRTLNDLRRKNRRQLEIARAKRFELLKNAASIAVAHPRCAPPGSNVKLRVDVTNKVAGHNFPTGFTAERQAWVSVTVRDPSGRVVFVSGDLDANGDLRDEHSHAVEAGKLPYDKHLLNLQSKFVATTFRGTERTVILPVNRHLAPLNILRPATSISPSFGRPPTFRVAKGSIPPLATVGRDYPIHLPDCPGDYCVQVRLNFRHLPPALFDKIGISHLKHLLEIVVIDEYHGVLRVH